MTMVKVFAALLFLLGVEPPHGELMSCSFTKTDMCCAWQYEEVGCYHYFDVRESWCLEEDSNAFKWVFKEMLEIEDFRSPKQNVTTWHDKYVEDNCRRCPECCVEDSEDWEGMYDDQEEFLRNASPEERAAAERLWHD
jgi:hypothetical protein